jgi:putative ABC transport system permease protein
MKPIEANNQVNLGFARCARLALSGMSYRMFRSLVTMSILALAVAFLVHMIAFGLLANQTQRQAYDELQEDRELGRLLTRLTAADGSVAIVDTLADDRPDRHAEYGAWAGADQQRLEQARQTASDLARMLAWVDEQSTTDQAVLTGGLRGPQLIEQWADPQRVEQLLERIDQIGRNAPMEDDALRALLLERRGELAAFTQRVQRGHARAIASLMQSYDQTPAVQLLAEPPADLRQTLEQLGYRVSDEQLTAAETFADRRLLAELIGALSQESTLRQALAREADLPLEEISLDAVLNWVDDQESAAWLTGELQQAADRQVQRDRLEAGVVRGLEADAVLELAERRQRDQKLESAVGDEIPADHGGLFGLPTRTRWLIALSFLVCVVGVANAMLMSVTERFTEIATMKCLGALDKFVMLMFVIEAAIQGIVGGLIGLVLGIVLALLRGLVEFGTLLGEAGGALGQVGIAAVLSLLVGMVLATVAAVGPSFVAARLAPMEAMRVD